MFGDHEVGIGFSGFRTEDSSEIEGIALAGKRSLRLAASPSARVSSPDEDKIKQGRNSQRGPRHRIPPTIADKR
ncbi:hypothetical protein [Bradyrhizobium sp. 930_D9_N1_4]|uniref:hypothetical protein n=1 Tax=Bradyrhizobium sp. 930_D9_N1_4 TaxID=3240374 RepID=UPI003F8951D7